MTHPLSPGRAVDQFGIEWRVFPDGHGHLAAQAVIGDESPIGPDSGNALLVTDYVHDDCIITVERYFGRSIHKLRQVRVSI